MAALPKQFISVADYLAGERISQVKHEYFAGQVFAMAGASERHNLAAMNVGASLHSQLRKRSCTVYPSDMRVKISATGLYTYPDVIVVCGTPRFEDNHRDTLLNPTLVVEVLSPSTESYDRGKKFQHYRTVDSISEVLLIAQNVVHVEHYVRQPGERWVLTEADQLDAVLRLPSIQCDLALADIYEKVTLDAEETLKTDDVFTAALMSR
jgi:Uma2 family endonuclease